MRNLAKVKKWLGVPLKCKTEKRRKQKESWNEGKSECNREVFIYWEKREAKGVFRLLRKE